MQKADMELIDYKELVIGSILYHFDGALEMVGKLGGSGGKAPAAIENVKASLVSAATKAVARVYENQELSSKILTEGIDLAYRHTPSGNPNTADGWIAALAISLNELDAHTQKVVKSWHEQVSFAPSEGIVKPRRLVIFISASNKIVTTNPVFSIANETESKSIIFTPCVFQWSIPQPVGPSAVVGYVAPTPDMLERNNAMFAIIDSSHASQLIELHVNASNLGTAH